MGKHNKTYDKSLNYIESDILIKNSILCRKCPAKIINSENKIKFGIGNIYGRIMIIIASHYNEELVNNAINYITTLYNKVKDFPIEQDIYIARDIKCFAIEDKYDIIKSSKRCYNFLFNEISTNPNRIFITIGKIDDCIIDYITDNIHKPVHKLKSIYPILLNKNNENYKKEFEESFYKAINFFY